MSHSYNQLALIAPISQDYLCENPNLDWNFVKENPKGIKIDLGNLSIYHNCDHRFGGYFFARQYLISLDNYKEDYVEVEYYEYDTKTGLSTLVSKNDFNQGVRYNYALDEMIKSHITNNLDYYLFKLFETLEFKSYLFLHLRSDYSNFVHGLDIMILKQIGIKMLNENPSILENLASEDIYFVHKFNKLNRDFIDNVYIIKKWSTHNLSRNPSLTWEFVIEHPFGFNEKWHLIFACTYMKLDSTFYDYVKLHPDGFNGEKWPLFSLLINNSLDWRFIDENIHLFKDCKRNPVWECTAEICSNPNLYWEFIYKHPDGINGSKWDMQFLCYNANLGEDFWIYILENPNGLRGEFDIYPWNMSSLSSNTSLPWNLVLNNPKGLNNKPWDMENLCKNEGLEKDFFEYIANNDTFFGTEWNYDSLCKNGSKYLIPILFDKFKKMNLSPLNIEFLLWGKKTKKYVKDILTFNCFKDQFFMLSIRDFKHLISSNKYLTWDYFIKIINNESSNMQNVIDTAGLFQNDTVTKDPRFWKFVKENPNGFYVYNTEFKKIKHYWKIGDLEKCPNFDWSLLDEFPNGFDFEPWYLNLLVDNPSFTTKIIEKYPNGLNEQRWPTKIWGKSFINDYNL